MKEERRDKAQRQERDPPLCSWSSGGRWGHVMCLREAAAEVSGGDALTVSAARRHFVGRTNNRPSLEAGKRG